MGKNIALTVTLVALTIAVYHMGMGAGANRKEAEMQAAFAMGENSETEATLSHLNGKVTDLEAKDKAHEAAMTGAAQRLVQLQQVHDNWVRQSSQRQTITRGMIALLERGVTKEVGKAKWEKYIKEAQGEFEAEQKKITAERVKAAKVKAATDAAIRAAVNKAQAAAKAKAKAKSVTLQKDK